MFEIKLYLGYFPAILAKNTLKRQNTLFFQEIKNISDKIFSQIWEKNLSEF